METLKLLFFILTCCLELLFKLFEHADPAPGDLKSRLDHVLLGTDLLPECRHEKGIWQCVGGCMQKLQGLRSNLHSLLELILRGCTTEETSLTLSLQSA